MRDVGLTAQTMITGTGGMDDIALRLLHHAAAARRRAEEERRAGDQDAVFFLVSLAIALERDAARAARVGRWRWVLAAVVAVAAVALAMWGWHRAF